MSRCAVLFYLVMFAVPLRCHCRPDSYGLLGQLPGQAVAETRVCGNQVVLRWVGVTPDSLLCQGRTLAARYRADAEQLAARWPTTAKLLRELASDYDSDARLFDLDADWREQFGK